MSSSDDDNIIINESDEIFNARYYLKEEQKEEIPNFEMKTNEIYESFENETYFQYIKKVIKDILYVQKQLEYLNEFMILKSYLYTIYNKIDRELSKIKSPLEFNEENRTYLSNKYMELLKPIKNYKPNQKYFNIESDIPLLLIDNLIEKNANEFGYSELNTKREFNYLQIKNIKIILRKCYNNRNVKFNQLNKIPDDQKIIITDSLDNKDYLDINQHEYWNAICVYHIYKLYDIYEPGNNLFNSKLKLFLSSEMSFESFNNNSTIKKYLILFINYFFRAYIMLQSNLPSPVVLFKLKQNNINDYIKFDLDDLNEENYKKLIYHDPKFSNFNKIYNLYTEKEQSEKYLEERRKRLKENLKINKNLKIEYPHFIEIDGIYKKVITSIKINHQNFF
jgi:hypothetical protein